MHVKLRGRELPGRGTSEDQGPEAGGGGLVCGRGGDKEGKGGLLCACRAAGAPPLGESQSQNDFPQPRLGRKDEALSSAGALTLAVSTRA